MEQNHVHLAAEVGNLVVEVDNLVAEVDSLVAEVYSLVAEVYSFVAEVNSLVAGMDSFVAGLDSPVAEVHRHIEVARHSPLAPVGRIHHPAALAERHVRLLVAAAGTCQGDRIAVGLVHCTALGLATALQTVCSFLTHLCNHMKGQWHLRES